MTTDLIVLVAPCGLIIIVVVSLECNALELVLEFESHVVRTV